MLEKVWLTSYPKEIPIHIDYLSIPIQHILTQAYDAVPMNIAIHFMGKDVTYKELYESALKLANYLQWLGIEKGDRVAIMLPNCPQYVMAFYGILYAGGVVVPVNPLYTEDELLHPLQDARVKVVIVIDVLYPSVVKMMKQTSLQHIVITKLQEYLPFPKNKMYPMMQKKQNYLTVHVEHSGMHHLFSEIMVQANAHVIELSIDVEEDIALLQYTGGTTGVPKGVMLTHKNLVANTVMCEKWMYRLVRKQESILGVLPFFTCID